MTIHITIPVAPVPWQRARTGGGRHFTDPKVEGFKRTVAALGRLAMAGAQPLAGPLAMVVECVLPIPPSWSKARAQKAAAGEITPASKPDWDNLGKGVSDALNGIVYADDAQVVDGRVVKRYGANPCVLVEVRPWAP